MPGAPVNGWAITGSIGQDLAWRSGSDLAAPGSYLINYPTGMYTYAPGSCFQIVDVPTLPDTCTLQTFASDLKKNLNRSIAMTYLRTCDSQPDNSCFKGFKTIVGSTSTSAQFVSYQTGYVEPAPFLAMNAPDLGSPSLWSVDPSLTSHGTGNVMVLPRSVQIFLQNGNIKLANNPQLPMWGLSDYSLEVVPYYPVKFIDMPAYVPDKNAGLIPSQYDPLKVVNGHVCPRYAIWADSENCYLRDSFVENVRVSATVKLPMNSSLRFGGRISNPEIALTQANPWREVQITGFPIQVPGALLTDWLQARTLNMLNGSSFILGSTHLKLEQLRKIIGDKYNYTIQQWKITSAQPLTVLPSAGLVATKRALGCLSSFWAQDNSLESLVVSNAMMGQSSAPTYDGKKITYQLGGMHYGTDGSLFSGDYQVIMNAKLARCVYGITGAIKAEISITDFEGGNQKVFTQALSEKDGLLRLRVSGFHFSDPVISFAFVSGK